MRVIWKASIAIGLVHISCQFAPSHESQSVSLLSAQEGSFQNRYQRVSEGTGKEVPADEIVCSFEVEQDNFAVISDDELKEAALEKSAAIEI